MTNAYAKFDMAAATAVATAAPTEIGFSERFSAEFDRSYTLGTASGRDNAFQALMDEQDKIIKDNNLGIQIPGRLELANHGRPIQSDVLLEAMKANREAFDRIRAERPELGLKTISELEQQQLSTYNEIMQNATDASNRSSNWGYVGALLGGAVGYGRDPLGAASLLAPGAQFKAGMSYLQTIKTFALTEMKLAAVPLAVNKPGELEVRAQLGEELGVGQVLGEAGAEVALAGVLGGLAGGVVRGVSGRLRASQAVVEDISELETTMKAGSTVEEHTEALNEAIDTFAADGSSMYRQATETHVADDVPDLDDVVEQHFEDAKLDIDQVEEPDTKELLRAEASEIESDVSVFDQVIACMNRGGA